MSHEFGCVDCCFGIFRCQLGLRARVVKLTLLRTVLVVFDSPSQSEVADLYFSRVTDQNIPRRQVAVDQALVLQVRHATSHLPGETQSSAFGTFRQGGTIMTTENGWNITTS